jgi:hypothetical protein
MSSINGIVLTSFINKVATALSSEAAKAHEKKILKREAMRRVNIEMTKQDKALRKEKKYYEEEYPLVGATAGAITGGILGSMAVNPIKKRIESAMNAHVHNRIQELYNKKPKTSIALGMLAGLGHIGLDLATATLPISTGVGLGITGFNIGDWLANRMIKPEHYAAEEKYQSLWDKHRYDPELQRRAELAAERLKTASKYIVDRMNHE